MQGVPGAGGQAHPLWRRHLLLLPGLLQKVDPESDLRHLQVQETGQLRDHPQVGEFLSFIDPGPSVMELRTSVIYVCS